MFFPSWKTVFKLSRHLLDTWLAIKLLSFVLITISADHWQLGGSIEKVPGPSIASRQLVDRLSFCSCVLTLFLDTFSTAVSVDIVFFDIILDRCLDTSRHLYLLRITKDLYIGFSRSSSHFLDLSWSIRAYSPLKHFLLPLNLQPTWFSAFPCF